MKPITILHLFLCCLTAGTAFGQEPAASGLLFSSKTESISKRTSLELFDGKPRKYGRQFSISFELSIRDAKRFGYILRLIDPDNEEVSLVFVNFRKDNNYCIDFNTTRTGRNVQMRIPPDLSGTGKWIPVQLDFDLEADKAVIRIDNTLYECEGVGLAAPAHLRAIFGLYGINLDLPAMALKNIRICERGRTRYVIPLNESTGDIVHDNRGREVGTAKNPTWLITEHFNWNPAASFPSQLSAGIAYNSSSNEVYVVNTDSLTIFQTDTRTLVSTRITRIPHRIDEAIYNPKSNQTYLYNLNAPDSTQPTLSLLNMETLTIDRTAAPRMANRLHHHNAFFEPECDTLFIFGGYGNFSYSNRLHRYDPGSGNWESVPLQGGDSVYPRFFAATGEGRSDYEMLMFGGFGNKSGRQELGGKNLYDLTAIDLGTKSARKLWEITTDSLYVPATNLVMSRDKKYFYALIYPHHVAASHLSLCRFDIATGEAEIVSDRIPILSEEIATKAFLFWNAPMSEFIAVVREFHDKQTANLRIYTLSGPPVSARELVEYAPRRGMKPGSIVILAITLAAIGALVVRMRRRKRTARLADAAPKPMAHAVHIRRNAIYVFGDFLAFDARGTDITYRFSTKLRMLYALLLFHSKEQDNGISTEKLTATLWPEKEVTEAKNIRGVTINHLRKILGDIQGIELVCENSRWRFVLSEPFYSDYLCCMSLCRSLRDFGETTGEQVDELVRAIGPGTLFPSFTEPWMESSRLEFEKTIEPVFHTHIRKLYLAGNYDRIVALAEALFAVDPLNEDMLAAGISSLQKMGRPDRALMLYNDFCIRFRAALGVDYPKPFTSF